MWFALWLVGCEDDGDANVAACEAFLDGLVCGEQDWSAVYDEGYCETYRDSPCPMGPYWACLSERTTCDPDEGGISVDLDGACESEADCLE
ncbi:MAG: hypothetical protein ABMA64_11360 [Myxococcota bacterium]